MINLGVAIGEEQQVSMHVNTRRAEKAPSRIFTCFFSFPFLFDSQDAAKSDASAYAAIRMGVGQL